MESPHRPREHKVRFDGTITLGHILTFVGFICAGAAAWTTLDKRVTVLEEARIVQAGVDRRQDDDRQDMQRTMREDLKDISKKLDYLLEINRK